MIPFLDLQAQYRSIRAELEPAVLKVLASGQYALGPEVAAFEAEFAEFCDVPYAVAVNTGTSALHLALLAIGVQPGDEVITVASTFVATVAAIDYCGARPVFVDVEPDTLNMDPGLIEARITERTKAILPVHLHGQPADMDPILAIAHRHGLKVIEDAAQAHDAEYRGRRVGSLGDLACFSFYPGKNLGACGEGGMVVTANPDHAETLRMLRDWGQSRKYHHVLKGFNYRMDGIQGAVLRVKLRHLKGWTEARRRHAALYDELLAGAGVETPVAKDDVRHVYHIYAIRSDQRDTLQKALAERGISTAIHYPIPVHLQKAYAGFGFRPGDLPVTEREAGRLLSLPMFAELSAEQVAEVNRQVREGVDAL